MKIIKIIPNTVVDGPHLRTSIYVSGCRHHCKSCHNPESWDFNYGTDYDVNELADEILRINNNYLTISGGDSMYSAKDCCELCKILKEKNPKINIWVYTGFTLEQLEESSDTYIKEYLGLIDGLVDGPFVETLKSTNVPYRGSSNQRIFLKINGLWIQDNRVRKARTNWEDVIQTEDDLKLIITNNNIKGKDHLVEVHSGLYFFLKKSKETSDWLDKLLPDIKGPTELYGKTDEELQDFVENLIKLDPRIESRTDFRTYYYNNYQHFLRYNKLRLLDKFFQ